MATRTYYCPNCNGAGSTWTSPSNCANDPCAVDVECSQCDGSGHLQRTEAEADAAGLTPFTPSRRRWTGSRLRPLQDVLVTLASHRAALLADLRKFGPPAMSSTYTYTRRKAMKPVDLPLDDAHLLVSPETAAYFNELTRAA